jgi:hypothetical protein
LIYFVERFGMELRTIEIRPGDPTPAHVADLISVKQAKVRSWCGAHYPRALPKRWPSRPGPSSSTTGDGRRRSGSDNYIALMDYTVVTMVKAVTK